MLTAIIWTLFIGVTPMQNYPTLTACLDAKRSVLYTQSQAYHLVSCVPMEPPR